MKKILALVMVLILVLAFVTGCSLDSTGDSIYLNVSSSDASVSDTSAYKSYVQSVIDSQDEANHEFGFATLYDLDKDDIDELIIMRVKGTDFVYTICTLMDNEVVKLIEDEYFFTLAGGPDGKVYALESPDETLLAFKYAETDPGDEVLYTEGIVDAYSLVGEQLELVKGYELMVVTSMSDINDIHYNESTAKLNGESVSYDDYHKWISSYTQNELLNMHSPDSAKLENFVNTL